MAVVPLILMLVGFLSVDCSAQQFQFSRLWHPGKRALDISSGPITSTFQTHAIPRNKPADFLQENKVTGNIQRTVANDDYDYMLPTEGYEVILDDRTPQVLFDGPEMIEKRFLSRPWTNESSAVSPKGARTRKRQPTR